MNHLRQHCGSQLSWPFCDRQISKLISLTAWEYRIWDYLLQFCLNFGFCRAAYDSFEYSWRIWLCVCVCLCVHACVWVCDFFSAVSHHKESIKKHKSNASSVIRIYSNECAINWSRVFLWATRSQLATRRYIINYESVVLAQGFPS